MKPKKINKKLSFSKSTIADVNPKDLNNVRGGHLTKYLTCNYVTCLHIPGTGCVY